jgi:UDP-GlcNAc:undecaprenyl-phosphate GlcNAc-1-phosphate transferase
MVVLGVQFYWLPLPGRDTFSLPPMLGAILAALLIIAMAQAVNFIDGLDGLAAGVCLIGALAFFTYAYLQAFTNSSNRALPAALIMVAVAGACLGFLPHNMHPTRIFMGDSGALPLGGLMGGATVNLTGFQPPSDGQPSWLPVLLPLILTIAVMAVPTLDLVLAVIRRTRAGRLPFSADQGHLHHRMLDMGHSHRTSVLLLWAWAAVVAFGVVLIGLIRGPWPVVAVTVAVACCLVGTLVTPTRIRRRRRRRQRERIRAA